jgi:hypothetical protein
MAENRKSLRMNLVIGITYRFFEMRFGKKCSGFGVRGCQVFDLGIKKRILPTKNPFVGLSGASFFLWIHPAVLTARIKFFIGFGISFKVVGMISDQGNPLL